MPNLEAEIGRVRPLDAGAMRRAADRQDILTKPRGSLGVLEDLSVRVAGMRADPLPQVKRKAIVTMAADHGVAARGVSLYPPEVTAQMVANFLSGGAAINVLSRTVDALVVVVDMGVLGPIPASPDLIRKPVARGTSDMCSGPAMTRPQAIQCLESGIAVVEAEVARGLDILGIGEMGIGNSTPAAAIISVMTGKPVAAIAGRGTGVGDDQLAHKIRMIEEAIALNRPDPHDAIDVLSKVGGFEIGGLAGCIIAAAANRVPVVIDGFISGAAALIAAGLCPGVKEYLIASHLSADRGHVACLEHLGLSPLFDLRMRLGEGTGAALGIFIVEAATRLLREMATFSEAGVSDIEEAPAE